MRNDRNPKGNQSRGRNGSSRPARPRPEAGPQELGPSGLPAFFEPLLARQYNSAQVEAIVAACGMRRRVTLRANALRSTRASVAAALDEAGIPWQGVPWYADAFVLGPEVRETDLYDLPIFTDGAIYLQNLSAMLPALAMGGCAGLDVLDMCAAPGGKTCQIAALSGGQARITACELHVPRAEKLAFNLERQGARNVTLMRTDARQLDDMFSFDRILLDAPCTGSGTLSTRDSKMPRRFTRELLHTSKMAQKALLVKALSLLKPGGELVYSTCSVLAEENEEQLLAALKAVRARGAYEVVPIELPNAEDVPLLPSLVPGALCVCPTDLYEGFFMVKLRRQA